MDTDAQRYGLSIGDTFPDRRKGRTGDVSIIDITPDGSCFQIRGSDMGEDEPCPYVTAYRLSQIAGIEFPDESGTGKDAMDEGGPDDGYIEFRLRPADYLYVTVRHRDDGGAEITYYAHADVWNVSRDDPCRALQNNVRGKIILDASCIDDLEAVAGRIAWDLTPYRLSPDTDITTRLIPNRITLMQRLKGWLPSGPAPMGPDALTLGLEAALISLRSGSPGNDSVVLI